MRRTHLCPHKGLGYRFPAYSIAWDYGCLQLLAAVLTEPGMRLPHGLLPCSAELSTSHGGLIKATEQPRAVRSNFPPRNPQGGATGVGSGLGSIEPGFALGPRGFRPWAHHGQCEQPPSRVTQAMWVKVGMTQISKQFGSCPIWLVR